METTESALQEPALRQACIGDGKVEQEFRLASLPSDGRVTSIVAAAWLIAVVIPPSVAALVGSRPTPVWLVATRLVFTASLLAVAFIAPRLRRPPQLDALVLAMVVVGSASTFAMHSWVARDDNSFLIIDAIPVVGLWTAMPSRFVFQGIGAALVSVRTLLVLAVFRDPPTWRVWMSTLMALVVANAIGAFVSWSLHRSRRMQFLATREQRAAREALQTALAQVRTLRGLVPVCTCCKAIRMPDGTWRRLEEVLTTQTEAELTHGFCEACLERLYPE